MRDARYVRLISWTLQSGSEHWGYSLFKPNWGEGRVDENKYTHIIFLRENWLKNESSEKIKNDTKEFKEAEYE